MEVVATAIPEVRIIRPVKHLDGRGFFSETYKRRELEDAGISIQFVQDNHSLSVTKGVVRGLHYQLPPFAQDKLIRVVRGAIFDVAVDLRRRSSTFGRHVSAVLSADNWDQILVPQGFAHGVATLEPDTEILYKVSAYYSPGSERGIFWADPELAIEWPVLPAEAIVSERDTRFPRFRDLQDFF